ncbi:MAG: SAF domain-containing protein [Actinomycetales bacterium]|nr:SAF domain-containing protein [Actinomycetales bacterium]
MTHALRGATVVAPKGRRRPGLITAGVALAMVGALVAVWLVTSAGDRADVVMLARDVPFGTTLTADDLTLTAVAVDPGVSTVSAADTASLVGQVAAADLVAGSLLAPGQVTAAAPPGPDEVLVPLPVSAERLPASGLSAGDRLLVVDTPAVAADPPSAAPESFAATVVRLGTPDLNGVSVIDVVVAEVDGPALAARAATGRFAVVLQSRGEAP